MKTAIRHILLICTTVLLFTGTTPAAPAPSSNTGQTRTKEQREKQSSISEQEAARFGRLLVQTPQGRVEPLDTYSSELLRKLHHRDRYGRRSANEFLLGLLSDPNRWNHEPLIYLPDKGVRELLYGNGNEKGTVPGNRSGKGKYAAFTDFFTPDGSYRLAGAVEEAYAKPPGERCKQERELLKADEKVNIFYCLLSGKLLALFPAHALPARTHDPAPSETLVSPDNLAAHSAASADTSGHSATTLRWYSPGDDLSGLPHQDSLFIAKSLGHYLSSLTDGSSEQQRSERLAAIETYQQTHARSLGICSARIRAELFYNRADIFRTAFRGYLILGALLLLTTLFAPRKKNVLLRLLPGILAALTAILFLWQTAGLGLRWYISQRAPWTNAYESMVYVGWTTVLAGLIFARRSRLTLALATLMGGVILFVSNLNWLDPQITPLVPVLKSYWLMIHVSVITASYGFFGISAITGAASLTAIIARKQTRELRIVGELSMLIGQVLLAAGIFLGAVWANESWGRYWGWDPKETWALITLLVYTLITHARHIPKLNNDFAFAALSVIAIYSVLMTFFGVNYYLSGLHAYGGSGEVPVLPVVYATLGVGLLILFAALRRRRS